VHNLFEKLYNEAIDTGDLPDYIDPGKRRKIEDPKQLGIPSLVPDEQFTSDIGSEAYKWTLEKLRQYNGEEIEQQGAMGLIMGLMQLLGDIKQTESIHKEYLEMLAVETVLDLPEFESAREMYDAGKLTIDLEIIDMEGDLPPSGEDEDFLQDLDVDELVVDADLEKQKRRFANLLVQGTAVNKMYLFQLLADEINMMDPELLNKYAMLTSIGQFLYWPMPEMTGGAAGEEEVDMDEDGTANIKVRAIHFPLAIHELVKGLAEWVALSGLPEGENIAKQVIQDVDTGKNEIFDIMLGNQYWERLKDAIGEEDQNLIYHVFAKLLALPAVDESVQDGFVAVIKKFLTSPESARETILPFVNEIKNELASYDAEGNTYQDSQPDERPTKDFDDPDFNLDDFLDDV